MQLRVSIDLEGPCQALIVPADDTTSSTTPPGENEAKSSTSFAAEITLSHLPPILLTLLLPPGYPLYEPATILSVHATHSWITSSTVDKLWGIISDIAREGVESGGEGVLWRVYELLRDGQILSTLDLKTHDGRLRVPHPTPRLLAPLLLSHNATAASQEFATQSYPCPICLTSVPGSKCTRLDKCGHVCCTSCLVSCGRLNRQINLAEPKACL